MFLHIPGSLEWTILFLAIKWPTLRIAETSLLSEFAGLTSKKETSVHKSVWKGHPIMETRSDIESDLFVDAGNCTVPDYRRDVSLRESLDKLAFRFFKLFAQYESTMKEHNFFSVKNGGEISVAWDRFANEVIGADFRNSLGERASAADYILQNPPMKQSVNKDGKIIWKEVSNKDKSAQALFGHIRRVRNNLFHGAKFNGTWFDPERSRVLLENSFLILKHYRAWLGH